MMSGTAALNAMAPAELRPSAAALPPPFAAVLFVEAEAEGVPEVLGVTEDERLLDEDRLDVDVVEAVGEFEEVPVPVLVAVADAVAVELAVPLAVADDVGVALALRPVTRKSALVRSEGSSSAPPAPPDASSTGGA